MLTELIRRTARLYADLPLVTDASRTVTARELAAEIEVLAARLAGTVVAGDRVAILARNRIEYVAAYFAAARLGAVLVPVNGRLKTEEIRHVLDDSRAVAVLLDPSLGTEVRPLIGEDRRWISFDEPLPGTVAVATLARSALPAPPADPSTVAVQLYTSGTTGVPKGAMLTHGNLWAVVAAYQLEMGLEPGRSRFLQVTPLFHVGGLLMLLLCVSCPCSFVLHPEFAPARVLDALEHDGVTHTLLVPAMIRWLMMQPGVKDRTFPALKLVGYGAAPMPPELLAEADAALKCDFVQGYGLTETAGVVTALRPADHRGPPAIRRSAGREIFGCEIRIVGRDGVEVSPGEPGEIVVRGPNVSPGYAGRPEATAEVFRDGWLHTGDVGTIDDQGYVTVVDRWKDLILVGGENVYPSEVEAVLRGHPSVAEVAVIGIPHRVWGEEVLAVVVPSPSAPADDAALEVALLRHARASLAQFKCPTRVARVSELPRNAAGKVLKQEVRRPYWEGRDRRV